MATTVETLVHRAHRRHMWNEVLAQFGRAASLFTGGIVLLLLSGADALDGVWWTTFFVAAAATFVFHLRNRICSPYKIAQRLDRRFGFSDVISTAYFFAAVAPCLPWAVRISTYSGEDGQCVSHSGGRKAGGSPDPDLEYYHRGYADGRYSH